MPIPDSWNQVPVTGTYARQDGSSPQGYVVFETMQQGIVIEGILYSPGTVRVKLVNGAIPDGFTLPSTDDDDLSITGWTYKVTEKFLGGREPYNIFIPHDSTGEDLNTIVPAAPPPEMQSALSAAVIAAAQGFAVRAENAALAAEGSEQDASNAAASEATATAAATTATGAASSATASALAASTSASQAVAAATLAGTHAGAASAAAGAASTSAAAATSSAASVSVIATQFGDVGGAITAAEAARDTAQGHAITAAASATAADTSADEAADSAAAAAASIAAGDIYPDTATGIAATTSGQYFSVPGADADDYLILYRNNAGSAVEVKRYPSASRVVTLEGETEGYRSAGDPIQPPQVDGWAWNVVDAEGKVAAGIKSDGTFSAKEISAEGITGLRNLTVGDTTIGQADAADYAWTVEDAEGKIALGVRRDGAVSIGELVNPPTQRPDRFGGGLFQHQINYINGTGQSLGYGGGPVQTTAQEYDNIIFDGLKPLAPVNFKPAFRGDAEDPRFGTMGHVKKLLLEENGITWQINDYQLLSANNAVSAMGIDALSEGGSTGSYEACLSQVTAGVAIAAELGKTFAFRAVTWTQGEADAGMSKATYKSKLMALADNFNADGKAITGQTQDVIFITYQVSSNYDKAVAVAQWEAAQESPLIYLATPMYFFTYIDGQHIHGDSTKWLGGYYGLVYKRVVIDGLPWEPLQPRSISVLDNNIDIVFNKDGLVFDTTMMPAVANMGFTVVNAALADQTINSVTTLPGNRVRLAMAGAPAAGWKVRYAHNVVTGKADYSSGGGNLRDRQGERITYHGHPMHNWCVTFDWEI